jgi:hypothetical protein
VCLFSSARQFLDDLPVDRGLRVHEALEVERIAYAATPVNRRGVPTPIRTLSH